MNALHLDRAITMLLLALWLLAFQMWWSQMGSLRLQDPRRFHLTSILWLIFPTATFAVTGIVEICRHDEPLLLRLSAGMVLISLVYLAYGLCQPKGER